MTRCAELREAVRAAIASGEYGRAGRLWQTHCRELEAGLGDARAGEELEETRRLLEWARRTVMGARALLIDQLNLLEVRGRYAPITPPPVHRVQISG